MEVNTNAAVTLPFVEDKSHKDGVITTNNDNTSSPGVDGSRIEDSANATTINSNNNVTAATEILMTGNSSRCSTNTTPTNISSFDEAKNLLPTTAASTTTATTNTTLTTDVDEEPTRQQKQKATTELTKDMIVPNNVTTEKEVLATCLTPTLAAATIHNDTTATDVVVPERRKKRQYVVHTVSRVITLVFACLVVSPMFSHTEQYYWQVRRGSSSSSSGSSRRNFQSTTATTGTSSTTSTSPLLDSSSVFNQPKDHSVTATMGEDNAKETMAVLPLTTRRQLALSYITDAVEKVGPSVVRIDTETDLAADPVWNQEDDSTAIEPSPGDGNIHPRPPPSGGGSTSGFIQQGQGSGLIISADGLVLTNAHVVEYATRVSVTLTDGRVFAGRVTGSDEITDIACVRLIMPTSTSNDNPKQQQDVSLPVADLGDSDQLQVGRLVIAVGSPGGLDNTVTMGIVSGLARSSAVVGIPHKKVDYIQTDAAVRENHLLEHACLPLFHLGMFYCAYLLLFVYCPIT
jgi:S1-C subfamily serine protease